MIVNSTRNFLTSILALGALPASANAASDGIAPYAYELFNIGGIPVTNSMLTSIAFAFVMVLIIRLLVGKATIIPSRGQAVVEGLVTGVRNTMEPIVGKKSVNAAFPIIICLFFFILIHNWTGLLPGVGAFGFTDEEGSLRYLFRPANSDLNNTIALAIVAMVCWLVIILRQAGAGVVAFDIFGNKADPKDTPKLIYLMLFPLFIAVGFIELISIAIRPVSLSLRLYGNVFGGENLLENMTNMSMSMWYIPLAAPFYLFETMVGLVQALVFALLLTIYIGLITNHDDGHHEEHH